VELRGTLWPPEQPIKISRQLAAAKDLEIIISVTFLADYAEGVDA
jgi:hypothetical protein